MIHSRPDVTGPGASKFRKKWTGPFVVLQTKGTNCKINQGTNGRWVNGGDLLKWFQREENSKGRASVAVETADQNRPGEQTDARADGVSTRTRSRTLTQRTHAQSSNTISASRRGH